MRPFDWKKIFWGRRAVPKPGLFSCRWLPPRGRAGSSSAAPVAGGGRSGNTRLCRRNPRDYKERIKSLNATRRAAEPPPTAARGGACGKRRSPARPARSAAPARTPFPSLPRAAAAAPRCAALLPARRGEAGPGRPRWRRGCWARGWTWRPSRRPSPPSRRCAPAWRGSSTAWRMGCGTRRPWKAAKKASWPPSRRACTPSAATWGEQPAPRGLLPRVGVRPGPQPWSWGRRRGRERSPGDPRRVPACPWACPRRGARRRRFCSWWKYWANKCEEAPFCCVQPRAWYPSVVLCSGPPKGWMLLAIFTSVLFLFCFKKEAVGGVALAGWMLLVARRFFCFPLFFVKKKIKHFLGSGSVASKWFKNDNFITRNL